ncbi:MAG TPA: NAD(P)-binding protein [Lapillicoccus sp.]|nr:NAD(P)-binding protein [Lapillicoccus sp.]
MAVAGVEADYVVVGAGAMGMAFTDSLVEHADVRVALVDRRYGVGGHWLDAYPFVRLHQSSSTYGVASTQLGGNRVQESGPEAGMDERASAAEICAYYARVLTDRLLASDRVSFYPNCEYVGDGRFVSHVSGQEFQAEGRRRIVNAHYLSPLIPATSAPPFEVAEGCRVIPVNDLVHVREAPRQYVVAGSGKTATDACLYLLENGVDPDAIVWVRPRDPWMINRASVQPDPVGFLTTEAEIMEAAEGASSPDDLFFRMEAAGLMVRIDPAVTPTMAKIATLAHWELAHLRTIERVVRLGRIVRVEPGRLVLTEGEVPIADDAVVVHCAASGLRYPPLVPIWGPDEITLQPIRNTYACFGPALAGYVEAIIETDAEKNRMCPPVPFSNTTTDWARQQVLGSQASLTSHPDVDTWAKQVSLNPARIAPELIGAPSVVAAERRFLRHVGPGLARMAELADMSPATR